VVDDEHGHGFLLCALQLQTQLLLQRGEDVWRIVDGVRIEWSAGTCGHIWNHAKNDPTSPPRDVTVKPAAEST